MLPAELITRIRQLYYAEHWRVGTIAEQLGVSAEAVRRALGSEAFQRRQATRRRQALDPYRELLRQTLQDYPRLRATRLYEMVQKRGYTGSVVQLRRVVRELRPQAEHEAYLRLRTLPGEQAQVDWAHFGQLAIGSTERRLYCFVMVLSYSRALYCEFFLEASLECFLSGHVRAFESFRGVVSTVLHDNLKSAVLARRGELVRFHPHYLELAGHYCFEPRPCRPRRGNEKGRVERAIRYLRDSFFAARSFAGLADLNQQVRAWCDQIAHRRPWPQDPSRTVAAVLAEEQSRLHPLPQHPFPTAAVRSVVARKSLYIRFDGNDYSIPPSAVGRQLTLLATDTLVRILDQQREIARHDRCYDRRQVIETPAHKEALLAIKRRALGAVTSSALLQQVPECETFIDRAFVAGETAATTTRELETLLALYGAEALRRALTIALERKTPSLASVRYLLEKHRRQGRRTIPPALELGDRPELEALHVKPHDLEAYDDLCRQDDDDDT